MPPCRCLCPSSSRRRYNDQSVLENHHTALAFWLARSSEECDWMAPLNDVVLPGDGPRRTAFLELRETMCVAARIASHCIASHPWFASAAGSG